MEDKILVPDLICDGDVFAADYICRIASIDYSAIPEITEDNYQQMNDLLSVLGTTIGIYMTPERVYQKSEEELTAISSANDKMTEWMNKATKSKAVWETLHQLSDKIMHYDAKKDLNEM